MPPTTKTPAAPAPPPPAGPPVDPEEFALLDAFVTAIDDALAQIDRLDPAPLEQLAIIAVGAVRGVQPLLRDERDRQATRLQPAAGK